ncbi:MAG: hypothetical protein HYZ79_01960, partial [Candidatus Melainabacteria bacterium]|nr:hypothetical protein [Candidatus Melainabacteria bacterium]
PNNPIKPPCYYPTLSVKTFLTEFANKAGNREWQVAYHPYSANPVTADISYDNLPYVTFGNIGAIVGWLRQAFPNNPSFWNIQITEVGITSLAPKSSEEKQASILCDAFRNVLGTPGIDSFTYHRMRDHPFETNPPGGGEGLALGLRNADGSVKKSWAVWALANRKDINKLSCGFEDLPYTRLKRGFNPSRGHIVSTRILPGGFNIEWSDVGLLRNEVPDSELLYECLAGSYSNLAASHSFISKSPGCENLIPMGPVGYILKNQQPGTIPLWRCSVNNGADHFVSKTENCEAKQTELFLGYAYQL